LTNVARVSTRDVETDYADNVYTRTAAVAAPTQDMYIYKYVAGAAGTPGGEMRYYLYFGNSGNALAQNVVITDELPAGVEYVSWYGYMYNPYVRVDRTITPTVAGSRLVWNIGAVQPGQYGYVYINVRLAPSLGVGNVLTNVARISTSDADPSLNDNVYTRTTQVISPTWDLYVGKDLDWANKPAYPGGEMTYEIYFSNYWSNQAASNVILTDTLPPNAAFVSWSGYLYYPLYKNLVGVVTPTVSGNQVVWQIGSLATKGYGYLQLTVRVDGSAKVQDKLVNEVRISSSELDADLGDNVYVYTTRVILPRANVYVDKTLSSAPGAPGGQMTYRIYFENYYANQTAADVIITDTLPPTLTFLSWTGHVYDPSYRDLAGVITPTVSDKQVVWRIGSLPVGSYGYLYPVAQVTGTASIGERLTNIVTATTSSYDDDLSDNADAHYVRLTAPTLNLSIYKCLLTAGAQSATGAACDERARLQQMAWEEQPKEPTPDETVVEKRATDETVEERATDETVVDSRATDEAVVEKRAPDDVNKRSGLRAHDSRRAQDEVLSPLSITGGGGCTITGTAAAGSLISYSLYFRNLGNTAAHNVIVTDTLPAGMAFVSWSGVAYNPGQSDLTHAITPTLVGDKIIWNLGTVGSGGYGYIYPTVRVSESAALGAELVNTAHIAASGQESLYTDNTSHVTVTVTAFVSVISVTIKGPQTGYASTSYVFTATVGPADATRPIVYIWSPEPQAGQGTPNATYTWPTPGAQTITVTATNGGTPVADTHTINISGAPPVGVQEVTINGPATGYVGTMYVFTAAVSPATATLPINYVWTPAPLTGQGSANAAYRWVVTGAQTITVTASNAAGSDSDTHAITLAPLPPMSTTVGPAGGFLIVYTDTHGLTITLEIPAGAVSETTELRFTPIPSPTEPISAELDLLGNAFDLDAYRNNARLVDFTFFKTVTLTVRYWSGDLNGIDEATLELYRWVPSFWQKVGACAGEGQTRDTDRNAIIARLRGLSRFGVCFAKQPGRNIIYLPVVLRNH
jgi:uncharacterized repeat protein (TIGR01451 family)